MSRSERRAYQRMTRNQDPFALPPGTAAARARMERQRARRTLTSSGKAGSGGLLGGRMGWIVFGGGAAAFLLGLSVAWPTGPTTALLAGIGAGIAWMSAGIGFAVWRRRAAVRPADGRSPGAR